MALLPILDNNVLKDGSYIHLLPFCKKHCTQEKCARYYQYLKNAPTGAYCCPFGLSSFVYATQSTKIIFSGLRIRGNYDKKKSKVTTTEELIFNPVMSEENCFSIAKEVSESIDEKNKYEQKLEAIRDLLHETRSLNTQVKNTIDQLWEAVPNEEDIEYDALLNALKNAHICSYMISNRFSYFDSVLNPSLSVGTPYQHVIFKKFDKMRKLLKGYMRKNVWISVNAQEQSDYRYRIYPTFEILLFILLENAIKYSPANLPVNVNFVEVGSVLDVTIASTGPYCDENELTHLCQKGYRGENAKAYSKTGQGFGLNFAKKICNMHDIGISFSSIYSHKDHGIKYGTFSVHLHFDNSK